MARKLGSLRTQVFASPSYIERYGEPLHPDELQFHRTLALRKNRNVHNNRFSGRSATAAMYAISRSIR